MRAPPIRAAAPLRFLAAVAGLWICARAAILAPGWWSGQGVTKTATGAPMAIATARAFPAPTPTEAEAHFSYEARGPADETGSPISSSLIRDFPYKGTERYPAGVWLASSSPGIAAPSAGPSGRSPLLSPNPIDSSGSSAAFAPPGPALATAGPGNGERFLPRRAGAASARWSASAWLLLRRDQGGAALAAGGTLGGSQAGARISYRLGSGLSLSARANLPLRRAAGAEAAAGLEWRPLPQVPLGIAAERRQALGREGRSAFALTVHGGASRALPRRLRLDAYAQAGVVGVRARDLFADGAVRLSAPVGPVEIGAGAWGAAQPGAARLDAGPGMAYRLPVRGLNLRIEAGWRFRIAGDAAPRSGPALTLGTEF